MDFTNQYPFPGNGHQSYHQFMPIPPLTPSHSHSAPSDDYNNSPPDAYDALSTNNGQQFHGFDYAQQGFHQPPQAHHQPQHQHSNPAFPSAASGPPTPPTHSAFGQQQQQPVATGQQPAVTASLGNGSNGFDMNQHMAGDIIPQPKSEPDDHSGRAGSDEDMTPAQSKRKAQNRAAQRAFRERKERHVKDLETKLAELEAAQHQSSAENDRLKRDLQKMITENEILKATSNGNGGPPSHSPEPVTTGPMRYSPTDFASDVLQGHNNKTFSHRIVESADGQKLLAAGASWDYIIGHELFKQGLVDIGTVSEHLKTRAVCDGQGPVFSEKDVLEAIELSVACGSDDLL